MIEMFAGGGIMLIGVMFGAVIALMGTKKDDK